MVSNRVTNTALGLNLFELIDTAGMDCRRALSSDMSDFEDAVMAESSLRAGMDYIVTRNSRDYRQSAVPVCTPGEFLEMIKPEEEQTAGTASDAPCDAEDGNG